MSSVNKVILIGNLGADPEVRHSQDGTAITSMRIATSRKTKNGDQTEWHKVKCFGKLAELAGQYLNKGRQVYVEGRLHTDKYEKDGQTKYSTEVIAAELTFLGGKGSAEHKAAAATAQAVFADVGPEPMDDDAPF